MPRHSLLTDLDLHLFNEGTHARLYEKLGAHPLRDGAAFAVWAPDAERVALAGDFNGWSPDANPLSPRGSSGIWETFVPGAQPGHHYKFRIRPRHALHEIEKSDPFAAHAERPPGFSSRLWQPGYEWGDADWMAARPQRRWLRRPVSIYEVHLGSWRRVPEEGNRPLTYREIAPALAEYVTWLGFTHVELLPVMEHPFDGSWGYQTTGYFAPTSRFGSPQDFMFLVDTLHRAGIGVILDWVPSHFPLDAHALARFDGTHLYEHQDPRLGFHPDWTTAIFNYGRHEVRSFLLSSASCWLDRFHADALRVDAVASMLYLDYSRKEGEWLPNRFGGRENLDAADFLRALNVAVYRDHPGVEMIAEESTAWPGVSRPTHTGGLGFGFKWDMGWMNDTLRYFSRDPVHRRFHHGDLTFRPIYAFSENYVLPLSHDEVVHGKGALLARMPGDEWQKFANLRLLYALQWLSPGKKLLFMGGEFAQWDEWNHDSSLDWRLTQFERHRGVMELVRALNRLYRDEPALHQHDCEPVGFEWIDFHDADQSIIAFLRRGDAGAPPILCVFNCTPVPRPNYRLGVPEPGRWVSILDTDAPIFYGSGHPTPPAADSEPHPMHGRTHSITVTLPPLAALAFKPERS